VSPGSVSFDRAAEYYDRTRRITSEASAATTSLLADELAGRQPVLEIGVGTGLISLPLHAVGVQTVGLDLSFPMVRKLAEKAGGSPPFPIVLGDATRLPFVDDVFGGALARHVLHLIPNWRDAVNELARVVRPGGVLLINIGVPDTGPWHEVDEYLSAKLGGGRLRVGIEPEEAAQLDAVIGALGGRLRAMPVIDQESDLTLERYFEENKQRVNSWTWDVDDDLLEAAIRDTEVWARERFGGLDQVLQPRFPIAWRAYDLS
jgi:SAM-dependent methyltransferase